MDVPRSTLVGAARWLFELRRRDLEAARFILRTAPTYKNDLTPTQYELALEWIIKNGLVDTWGRVADPLGNPAQLVLIAAIDELQPSWLADADVLVPDTRDLPLDILEIGSLLGLDEGQSFDGLRSAWRKFDDRAQRELGAAGETAMLEWLAENVRAEIVHVSDYDDGAGFDIALLRDGLVQARVEVKATRRVDSVVIFLSRNELETMRLHRNWCLQVVSLDAEGRLRSLGWLPSDALESWAPSDGIVGVWQSMRIPVPADALLLGAAPPVREMQAP